MRERPLVMDTDAVPGMRLIVEVPTGEIRDYLGVRRRSVLKEAETLPEATAVKLEKRARELAEEIEWYEEQAGETVLVNVNALLDRLGHDDFPLFSQRAATASG